MQTTDTLEKSQVLTFRVTGRQKRLYEIAAKESGLTFLDFLRKSLDVAAEKVFRDSLIERMKRLQIILEGAGLKSEEIPWPRVVASMDWFPPERLESLGKCSGEDVRNYLRHVLEMENMTA